MKIKEITEKYIEFDNGNKIEFYYDEHGHAYNFADFKNVDSTAWDTEFDEELIFEDIDDVYDNPNGFGFGFGSENTPMFFIPCYSLQNGLYDNFVKILYDGKVVLANVIGEIK